MVKVEAMGADAFPAPGDEVQVSWGLDAVRGRVIESYQGPRPRVVVEIESGQVSEEPATVTVPLRAVEPREEAASPWAHASRFEKAVAEALQRVGAELTEVELNTRAAGYEPDMVVRTRDGCTVVVDVKSGRHSLSQRNLDHTLTRLNKFATELGGSGLLVSNQLIQRLAGKPRPRTRVVTWQSIDDDDQLATALEQLNASTS